MIDPRLKEFATPREAEIIDAVDKCGSRTGAAEYLGINVRNLYRALKSVKLKAASKGYDPDANLDYRLPEGQSLSGTSTLIDGDGNKVLQWVKGSKEKENVNQLLDLITDSLNNIKPCKSTKSSPKRNFEDALTVYPMGDPHIGMYSWGEECEDDYDIDIALEDNRRATERLVEIAPNSEKALIINVGDFFHADNFKNETPASGHKLDTDTRLPKVFDVGMDIVVYKIDLALRKHKEVHVRNAIGNHDIVMSFALSKALKAYYNCEPRVTVHDEYTHFWYFLFGKNLIGVTHGDKVKLEALGEIMAADKPDDWGKSQFRYWYTGHIHHKKQLELRGCVVESFRTLAARDAFNHGAGYRSERDMCCIVIHKDYGEVEKHTRNIRMLRENE